MQKRKQSKIKFSSFIYLYTHCQQLVLHEIDRPECNILNTETTEKEMAKIATTIIMGPEKLDCTVQQPEVAYQE